jgi:hypothetical protein
MKLDYNLTRSRRDLEGLQLQIMTFNESSYSSAELPRSHSPRETTIVFEVIL